MRTAHLTLFKSLLIKKKKKKKLYRIDMISSVWEDVNTDL